MIATIAWDNKDRRILSVKLKDPLKPDDLTLLSDEMEKILDSIDYPVVLLIDTSEILLPVSNLISTMPRFGTSRGINHRSIAARVMVTTNLSIYLIAQTFSNLYTKLDVFGTMAEARNHIKGLLGSPAEESML